MRFRILLETPLETSFYTSVVAGLNDKSPHVQRAATELLIKYPTLESAEAALSVLHKTKADYDNHLYYTARLALRNLLRNESVTFKRGCGEKME